MAARSEAEVTFLLVYKSPARKGGVLYSCQDFATPLRRIRFKDPVTGKRLVFLTKNLALPAITITELYRCRWQGELFQMDQAASSDQSLFRYIRERRQNPNLDRGLGLRARRHRQEAPQPLRELV